MNPQPLSEGVMRGYHCPHCNAPMEPFSHHCEGCNESVVEPYCRWSALAVDDVRSAVAGLLTQLAALSGFEAIDGNTQSERAYDNALRLVDEWFPVFAEKKNDQKKEVN